MMACVAAVDGLVDEHSGTRSRVVDEHMFMVENGWGRPLTARAQAFIAPRLRPVVVLTQSRRDGCLSLINGAERYAQACWERFAPEDDEPPLFVSNFLNDGDQVDGVDEASRPLRALDLLHVVIFFRVDGRYSLSRPRWVGLRESQLAELVGQPVDLTRGSGFTPPPDEPDPPVRHEVRSLLSLPSIEPLDGFACMPGSRRWRRIARQLFPRRRLSCCCRYHRADWVTVSRVAVQLVQRAHDQGLTGEALVEYVTAQQAFTSLDEWRADAIASLIDLDDGISVEDGAWMNGRHRTQAMIDAGVRRTVVTRLDYLGMPESQ